MVMPLEAAASQLAQYLGAFLKKKPPDNIRALPNVIQSKQCLH